MIMTATTAKKLDANTKQARLNEFDFQVAQRTADFHKWLENGLEDFAERQAIRMKELLLTDFSNMTLLEFGQKYNGNTIAARASPTKDVAAPTIDKDTWKRKWMADEGMGESSGSDNGKKAAKNPRLAPVSSAKKPGFGTGHKAPFATASTRLRGQQAPSSPSKLRQPFMFGRTTASPAKPLPRGLVKAASSSQLNGRTTRPPSSATFNPLLPKTPAYPGRLPRHDETLRSINDSPLTNPFQVGLEWFKAAQDEEGEAPVTNDNPERTLRRVKSQIIIRRDPSYSTNRVTSTNSTLHSRDDSSSSSIFPSSSAAHSLANSTTSNFDIPHSSELSSLSQQSNRRDYGTTLTTRPPPMTDRTHSHSMFAIPTSDGHLLEFDPLQTSPGALDALDGITDSAKKKVREDMAKLVRGVSDKWGV